jgi:DNA-binding IclR family transcriptional regulator
MSSLPNLTTARSQRVPSIDRAVKILNLLAAEPGSVGLASLSKRLQFPRSSTLALCNSLVEARLVVRDAAGSYRLGPHILALSRGYLAQTDMLNEFQRAYTDLKVLPKHNLVLGVLDATDVVYVGRRLGLTPVGVPYETGMRLPVNCTASGKALINEFGEDEIRALFNDEYSDGLPALTPQSITDIEALIEDLAQASEQGYTVDDDETALGMLCVGAAVRDGSTRIVGAVAASMVKTEIKTVNLPKYGTEIIRLANRISVGLGYPGEQAAARSTEPAARGKAKDS